MNGRMAMVALCLTLITLAGCTGPTGVDGQRDLTGFAAPTSCDVGDAVPAPRFPVAVMETNFGTIRADIFLDMVPLTAQNFIDLAEAGRYDGSPFHRIITDFMMQGGTVSPDAPNIQDEFHHELRHVGKGVLSMANAGPNTGSSQFFITFKDTTWLDDKHSVFGQVIDGFDVLDAVNEQAATQTGTPSQDVTLESVTIEYEERASIEGFGAALFAYDNIQDIPEGGGWARFIVVAESQAVGILPVCFGAEAPEGVTVQFESAFQQVDLPAGQRMAMVVDVEAPGPGSVTVTLSGPGGELDRLDLQLTEGGVPTRLVATGDQVTGNYIGVTTDGRVFDTSIVEVADFVVDNDLGYSTFQHRGGQYSTFEFVPGAVGIQGFTDIAVGTPEGMSNVGRVAPKDAFGESGQHALSGRTLLFQLDVIDVE